MYIYVYTSLEKNSDMSAELYWNLLEKVSNFKGSYFDERNSLFFFINSSLSGVSQIENT